MPPSTIGDFFAACRAGDLDRLRELLDAHPSLIRERNEAGATGLHAALAHPEALRLLLERGADPNQRDHGDNALPLHFAAGGGMLDAARLLLEAGSDVHGAGDAHRLDVIGWATCFDQPNRALVDLLIAHGARHHVFSAVALGDLDLVRRVVAADPNALRRRLSPAEQEQTALHYAVAPPDGLIGGRFRTGAHYRTLELLIELGAELEAPDAKGRTAFEIALLRSDREAIRILHEAGARPPPATAAPGTSATDLEAGIGRLSPMLAVSDVEASVAWYRTLGFTVAASHGAEGWWDWVSLRWGETEIMLVSAGPRPPDYRGLSLWIRTDRLDEVYARLRHHQMTRARTALAGTATTEPEIRFKTDLYTAFYGQREFTVMDPNDIEISFYQPVEERAEPNS